LKKSLPILPNTNPVQNWPIPTSVSFSSVKSWSESLTAVLTIWRQSIFFHLSIWQIQPAPDLWPTIAPTEFDLNLRKRLVQGEVHDEKAFAMGGVAGHAGVFSTAPDLAAFCQMLLNGGRHGSNRILKSRTISQFTEPQSLSNGNRALGWKMATEGCSCGPLFSARSFGHTGFTGTSLWIDPDKQLFVVLLTNRVNPTRDNPKMDDVRPALHDAAVQALVSNNRDSGGGGDRKAKVSRQRCAVLRLSYVAGI
jgi:CubicO group peptidase (beta-lactamase class C family)